MISEQAIIHPTAKIASSVSIGPGTVIGAEVEIGENTWIGPHAVIQGPTKIGKNNKIFQFASIGDAPQDSTYQGEPTRLEIGDENIFREFVTVSRGTVKGGGLTCIGHKNFFMAYSHVGHDTFIGNSNIFVNHAALSGHVTIADHCNIGAYAAIHQFCKVGAYAFIARATYVTKDVLPYVMIAGHETAAVGINVVGLKRHGFTSEAVNALRTAYKIIYRKGLMVQEALAELELMQVDSPAIIPMMDALNQSTRGIVR